MFSVHTTERIGFQLFYHPAALLNTRHIFPVIEFLSIDHMIRAVAEFHIGRQHVSPSPDAIRRLHMQKEQGKARDKKD
jgi:hypothetical protein